MGLNNNDLAVYDVNQVRVSFAGYPVSKGAGASGYADGPIVTIDQEDPDFKIKLGTDGSATRYATNVTTATGKVRMMQTSSTNAYFSTMLNKDKATPGGQGVGTFVVEDLQGTSLFEAQAAWITGPPQVVYDGEPGEREWPFQFTRITRLDGGN